MFRIQDPTKCFSVCLWSTCCFPVLNAKNYAVTDTCSYWPSICLLWCGYSLGWIPGACCKAMLSYRLKDNMDMDTNCCQEFALACCCPWCETGRESMMIDEILGVDIQCPFQVEKESAVTTLAKDVKEI